MLSIQTHGSLLNWNPHIHALVTDGGFLDDGTFVPLGLHDTTALTEAFRRSVVKLFVNQELFEPDVADSMLGWMHSGPSCKKARLSIMWYTPVGLHEYSTRQGSARMFQRNDGHRQTDMFGTEIQMSARRCARLQASWAATFYRDFFCRIDERIFSCLYADVPSRPNVPVNVLVAFEVLKAGHGWSDEEAYDAVCFDIQVRHALGMRDLYADEFCLRTVYNFRRSVTEHAATSGVNLFDDVFKQVTGEQQKAYVIESKKLRMDSTQVASNIANLSRLRLLATVLHRVHRALDEEDRARLADEFEPYVKGSAKKYAYSLRADEPLAHLLRIGRLMDSLVDDLKAQYNGTKAYDTLCRVYREHFFEAHDGTVLQRFNGDICAKSVQSPDDLEATYRRKAGKAYRGYVANITETCDEANKVQLIVDVDVEPNSADDGQMLVDSVEELTQRTEVKTLYTDGGYNGPKVDKVLADKKIELIQTGIRGGKVQGVGREDFDWEVDDKQKPVAVTCPGGQRMDVEQGRKSHTFLARFDEQECNQCPMLDSCPTKPRTRRPERVLRFTADQVLAALRARRSKELKKSDGNPRASVEATVWSVKARFPRGRVPYRGRARVAMYAIGSAAMVNVRRITALARRSASNDPGDAPAPLCGVNAFVATRRLLAALQRMIGASESTAADDISFAPALSDCS